MWTCFVLHLSASSTPPSSNQSRTRATPPSINCIKTTNRDQRAALPTASIKLTGVVNGWPKKNSRHGAHLTESLVRITGVHCQALLVFDCRNGLISGVQCQEFLAFELQEWVGYYDLLQSTPTHAATTLMFWIPTVLVHCQETQQQMARLNSHDKLYSTTDHLGGLVTHNKLATAMAVMTLTPNLFLSFYCSALPSRC